MSALELAHDLEPQETPEHALKRQTIACRYCEHGVVMVWVVKSSSKAKFLECFDARLDGLVLREDGWFATAAGGTRRKHRCENWPTRERITKSAPHFGFPNEDVELKNFHDAEQGAGR